MSLKRSLRLVTLVLVLAIGWTAPVTFTQAATVDINVYVRLLKKEKRELQKDLKNRNIRGAKRNRIKKQLREVNELIKQANEPTPPTPTPIPPLAAFPQELRQNVKHIIIVFFENRAFDNLFGKIPGVNGLDEAPASAKTQTDQFGNVLASLPQPLANGAWEINGMMNPTGADARFPATLPNSPYDNGMYVDIDEYTGDMIHNFYTEQYQINDPLSRMGMDPKNTGGAPMSKFSWWSTNPGLVMNNYDSEIADGSSPEVELAKQFALADNFYHSAFGGSFLNHHWLIASRSPIWVANPPSPAAPPVGNTGITEFDANGFPMQLPPKNNGNNTDGDPIISQGVSDRNVTNDPNLNSFPLSNTTQSLQEGDYWLINTTFPLQGPCPASLNNNFAARAPLQTYDTIGERLTAANITWAWFAGGWNDAKAGNADPRFQFHHQPFAYFEKYALQTSPVQVTQNTPAVPGVDSVGSAMFLKDYDADFLPAVQNGTIPTVSFVKPIGAVNAHNGYSNVAAAGKWLLDLVTSVRANPEIWNNCVIFVTADEHGGLWDHVKPPIVDNWGPGSRVPLITISPFAKTRFIDHSQMETVSLLRFISEMYNLQPLNERDAAALAPISSFAGQPDLIIQVPRGVAFEYQLPGYNEPFKFSASGDLGGLVLNADSGLLTGTAPNTGSFSSEVSVFGEDGAISYTMRLDVK